MKLVSRESFSKLKEWSDNIPERTFQETKERHRVKFQSLLNRNIKVNRFTPTDPEKVIINLSKTDVTPQQRHVLTLGLNFIPTPRHIPQVDIMAGTESLARFLPGHQEEQLRSDVQRCLSQTGILSPNLTKRQTAAIKELKVDSDTIIPPADKGNATVLLDKQEYNRKVRELLDDRSYQPIKKNPTLKIERKVTEVLQSLEKNGKLPNDLRKRVQNQQSSSPQLYGLPKIHKTSCPLRPIFSSINSPTYHLSRYLVNILSPLWGNTPHFVRNSEDFVKKIRGLQVKNEDKLISFDVKSLFTKVPIDLSLQIIDRRLREDNTLSDRTTLDPPTITTLTELCLRTTYFQYSNEFFEQKDGQPWALQWWQTSSWRV